MKPRIFIGSSTEGLPVAQRIKKYFDSEYECYIWNEGIFQLNEGFLETLLKSTALFDFGFMVFTSDDISRIRKKEYKTTRDNVLFEYGLFLGRLGLERTFIIKESVVKIPNDLDGITILKYDTEVINGKSVPNKDFEKKLAGLKRKIDENFLLGHLGFLPSTIIAICYYENFIKPLADEFSRTRNYNKFEINNKRYDSIKIKVVIPDSISYDMKRKANMYSQKNDLEEVYICSTNRSISVYRDKSSNKQFVVVDMPTILSAIDKAVEINLKVNHIGKTLEQKLNEIKEIENFTRVLRLLISRDDFCHEIIEFIDEDNKVLVVQN